MREQESGTGTRAAGKEMRIKILNLITAKPGYSVIIDWENTPIISSSFADEFIGKLFLKLGKANFDKTIKNRNVSAIVEQIINKAIGERVIL